MNIAVDYQVWLNSYKCERLELLTNPKTKLQLRVQINSYHFVKNWNLPSLLVELEGGSGGGGVGGGLNAGSGAGLVEL